MSWKWFLSRGCLLHPTTLTLLMIFYVPGTVYGYIWYGGQLQDTWETHPLWQLPFVPDSPTASLFFAIAVLWLWLRPKPTGGGFWGGVRAIVEALAVVTSIKYGIWATAVIFAGAALGDQLVWQDWMLVASHTAMAVCACAYARFFRFGGWALGAAAFWTFLNDTVDYGYGVYPYLPRQLDPAYLQEVALFTFLLTAFSVMAGGLFRYLDTIRGIPASADSNRF
ncbi:MULTISPECIES: DUF1405 domain-containing protein [Cohnella]|uniref:DUF1405 domain-containing protein n=1 Tax=Cohnella TaxID=329857 RepID=UPI0009B998F1|nr:MULTISPECIES: DUF1405 domain-containing protein [Cohnella]MBN2984285.1 DUF1405 domain-containing protein [Cohnella algarum]